MCFGGSVLVQPNEKAIQLAFFLKIAVALQIIVGIIGIICARYIDSIFLILFSLITIMYIHSDQAYNMRISCAFIMNCFYCVWGAVLLLLCGLGYEMTTVKTRFATWRIVLYWISISGQFLTCLLCAILSKLVYNELREIVINEMNGVANVLESGMHMNRETRQPSAAQAPPPSNSNWRSGSGRTVGGSSSSARPDNPWRDPNYNPNASPAQAGPGQTPFSGKGFRLSD